MRTSGKKLFPKKKIKTGWLCRVCGKALTGKKQNFCSAICEDHFKVCCWPQYARKRVWLRDKGFCAECGLDTERLKQDLKKKDAELRRVGKKGVSKAILTQLGLWTHFGHMWEADHIVPVAKGGGTLGLNNLQTLCIKCHRAKTAASYHD